MIGIKANQLKEVHSYTQNNLTLAKTKYESGDINGVIDASHDLKINLIELKDVYQELIYRGELTETMQIAVELKFDTLEEATDDMGKTI